MILVVMSIFTLVLMLIVRYSQGQIIKRIGLFMHGIVNKMNAVWKSGLNKKSNLTIFKSTVESIILYGSDTCTFGNSMRNWVGATQNFCGNA